MHWSALYIDEGMSLRDPVDSSLAVLGGVTYPRSRADVAIAPWSHCLSAYHAQGIEGATVLWDAGALHEWQKRRRYACTLGGKVHSQIGGDLRG